MTICSKVWQNLFQLTDLASQASVEQSTGAVLLDMVHVDVVAREQHVDQHDVALRGGQAEGGGAPALRGVDQDLLTGQKALLNVRTVG